MGSNPTLSAIDAIALGIAMIMLAALLLTAPLKGTPARTCATVSGAYAIYANHDLLRIDGSHHAIEVVSNALDKELEKRGWQETVARGRFTLCGRRTASPLDWTVRDIVDLVSFRDIRFAAR